MTQSERDAQELATQIETLDRELVALVERRAEVASKLGTMREAEGPSPRPVPPELVARALENTRGLLPRDVLARIVRTVATACAPLLEPARIAFVGTAGGSGHEAARRRFGDGAHLVSSTSIEAALAAVVEGQAVFAVVPYECKPAGIVDETVQALLAGELRVLACFDSRADAEDADSDESARAADAPTPSSQGAPASSDPPAGTVEMMRYAVIGARPTRRTGNDRTALVFTLADDAPGALHEVLMAFKECDVNLTHINSRPGRVGDPRHVGATSHGGWSYLFFVEMYGHVTDRAVITALDGARRATKFLRVLGSYARE